MLPLISLLSVSLLPPILALPHMPRSSAPTVHLTQHLVQISPLSPLLTYSPADAWEFTPYGVFTDVPGATVSIDYLGAELTVMGRRTGSVDMRIEPEVPQRYEGVEGDDWVLVPPMSPDGVLFHMGDREQQEGGRGRERKGKVGYERRRWSMTLPDQQEDEQEEWAMSPLTIEGVRMTTVQPSDWVEGVVSQADNLVTEPLIQADNSLNSFFRISGEWSMQVPTSAYDDLTLAPVPGLANASTPSRSAFATSAVLSTSAHSAALSFEVPEHTSVLQVYGNVGPDLGSARLRLESNAAADSTANAPAALSFGQDLKHGLMIDTYRPIAASGQLLALVWLDPRAQYTAVLRFEDERQGGAVQISGVTAKRYVEDVENLRGDWLQAWNEENAIKWTAPLRAITPVPVVRKEKSRIGASYPIDVKSVMQRKEGALRVELFAGLPPTWFCLVVLLVAVGGITGICTRRTNTHKRRKSDAFLSSEEGGEQCASCAGRQRLWSEKGQYGAAPSYGGTGHTTPSTAVSVAATAAGTQSKEGSKARSTGLAAVYSKPL